MKQLDFAPSSDSTVESFAPRPPGRPPQPRDDRRLGKPRPASDGWSAAVGFIGLGLLGVGLQVMVAECLLLDHGGICMCVSLPLRLLGQCRVRLRTLWGRWWTHLADLSSRCCPGRRQAQTLLGKGGGAGSSLLRRLPRETGLPAEVASWLSAADLFRWGAAAKELRELLDEACSEKQLLDEVKRLNLEREWGSWRDAGAAERATSGAASASTEAPDSVDGREAKATSAAVPAEALRRFLLAQAQRSDEEEQQHLAERRWQALFDLVRFGLLGVCWATFLCEVLQLAQAGENHTALMVMKAMASPFLFLYVLENSELRLGRSCLVSCIALGLLYECLHSQRYRIVWHPMNPQVPLAAPPLASKP